LCQDDWGAIMETRYLLSKPNMQASIISGMRENHRGLPTDLDW
jgi:PHD/YefM family antitoxin component YafN of YafNO toxin-antitoxin module